MTNYDRSKLARIVAAILDRDNTVEYARAQLEEYAPGATAAELNRAVQEGTEAYSVARLIGAGETDVARGTMGGIADAGAQRWLILARYRIRRGGEDIYRSATATAPSSAGPEGVLAAAREAVERGFAQNLKGDTNRPGAGTVLVEDSMELVFVAPLFREG